MTVVPFTFGIALTPRANARDWGRVQGLLDLTLRSVRAQTEGGFRLRIAGHERPRLPDDARITFTAMDWAVEPPGPHNGDSGRKKHWLNARVLEDGGGLFMLLDADDWVDRRTVEAARAGVGEAHVGGVIRRGWAVDLGRLRAAPLPHPAIFEGGFHRLCGSSTVALLRPDDPDPVRRDPFEHLRSHHQWDEAAAALGVGLADLPVGGAYLINTGENHSDRHGPHGDWRRGFNAAVAGEGRALDGPRAARFGLSPAAVMEASAPLAAV